MAYEIKKYISGQIDAECEKFLKFYNLQKNTSLRTAEDTLERTRMALFLLLNLKMGSFFDSNDELIGT